MMKLSAGPSQDDDERRNPSSQKRIVDIAVGQHRGQHQSVSLVSHHGAYLADMK